MSKLIKVISTFSLLCFISFVCRANISTPIIVENVINEVDVGGPYNIFQGKNTLWLVSENGLFGVTGSVTTHYPMLNTRLENNDILDVYEDINGKIWLATDGKGILVFTPNKESYAVIDNTKGLSSNLVQQFAAFDDSFILANTFSGIALINLHSLEVQDLLSPQEKIELTSSPIEIIISDEVGKVYFTQGQNRLYAYDVGTKHLQLVSWQNNQTPNKPILDVYVDQQKNVWVSTKEGLNILNHQHQRIDPYATFEHTPNGQVEQGQAKIYQDSFGQLWIATNQLFLLDANKRVLRHIAFSSISDSSLEIGLVADLAQGKNGELYIASQYVGLITVPNINQSIQILSFDDDYSNHQILLTHTLNDQRLLVVDKNNLHILDGHKVTSISTRALGKIAKIADFSSEQVLVITQQGRFLLFDTTKAIFSDITDSFSYLPKERELQINGVIKLEDDSFLVALSGGKQAGLYKGQINGAFSLLFPGFIEHMMLNSSGNLVFTTRNGVFQQKDNASWPKWDLVENNAVRQPDQGNWLLWSDPIERKNYIHHCLKRDAKGRLWICTDADGLAYYDKDNETLTYLNPELIRGAKTVNDITQDSQGYFWISTDKGLIRYDEGLAHSMIIDASKGLLDEHFALNASNTMQNQQLFIAGDNYSYLLNTAKLNSKLDILRQQKHQVLLNQLYVHRGAKNLKQSLLENAQLALTDSSSFLEVRHNEYLLSFELTTNNILERNNIRFEYRLAGLNDEWLQTALNQNVVSYITLPSGSYQFETRAVDDNSVIEQSNTSLNVMVMPPFWRSWPALVSYVVMIVFIAYLAFMLRTRQLKQQNTELDRAVKERTNQLHQSNQQVSELLNKKQAFFASVSHEFRTPLSLILGPLSVLLDKIDEPKLKQQVSLINRHAKRLNHMVDQVLDLARLDEAKRIQHKTYAAAQSINVIAEPFIAMAKMKNQQLVLQIDSSGFLVLMEDALEKIVTNLLSNAIKFTPEHGTITLKVSSQDNQLMLSVEDNGIGIAASDQQTIFERFSRVEGSEHLPGSGIGLALVKELVQSNNGQIEVKSEQGLGTKFMVIFPLFKDVDDSDITVSQPNVDISINEVTDELAQTVKPVVLAAPNLETILIVEDNPDMRSFIRDSLSADYHCITANDGRQGIDVAIEQLPDLVISDVMMPEIDGFALSATLRNHDTTSHIPLILLTAKGDEDSRIKAWNLDIDDYIAKPFDLDELKARIARLLAVRKILKKKFSRKIEMAMEQQSSSISDLPFTSNSEQSFFEKFSQIIEQNYTREAFGRSDAAALLSIGERQLNRKLSSVIDYNFAEYLRKYRLSKAKYLLGKGKQITEVSYDVGFTSPSYFSSCFKAEFELSPKEFVNQSTTSSA